MDALHAILAWVAAAAAVAVVVVGAAVAVGRLSSRRLVDRAILASLGATGAAGAAGLVLPLTNRPPGDPLHLLYGVVAFAALPLARYHARDGRIERIGRWVAVAGIVVVGAMLRLFMTGR
jgi:hypothetical protein